MVSITGTLVVCVFSATVVFKANNTWFWSLLLMYFCSVGCTFADHYLSSLVFTTAAVFVVLRNVMQMSANVGWSISQQARPFTGCTIFGK